MSVNRSQEIAINIDDRLSGLSSDVSNEQCIFKVNAELRSQSEKAYEPQMLSIGPYHRTNPKLQEMEIHKLRYLQALLIRRRESSAEKYVLALMQLEDRARRCYAEKKPNYSVEMMCLDGIFIIEFLRKIHDVNLRNKDDPIFQMVWMKLSIIRDLILFENQLPFFVLEKLFDMTKFRGREETLTDLAISALNCLSPGYRATQNSNSSRNSTPEGVIHLLDLMHKAWCSSFASTKKLATPAVQKDRVVEEDNYSLLELKKSSSDHKQTRRAEQCKSWFCITSRRPIHTQSGISISRMELIKSASELQKCGIEFEKAKESKSWLDITFEKGIIKIPPLSVEDHTETVLRNLIAHEEYYTSKSPKPCESRRCVVDYVTFMDLLIDSSRDVKKLRHSKIIENRMGSDDAVCTLFNKLGIYVTVVTSKFGYKNVFQEINNYSCRRWNIWGADLVRNYFSTPWSIISFIVAVSLLFLTCTQTVFSILDKV